jgi:hypothetical protein
MGGGGEGRRMWEGELGRGEGELGRGEGEGGGERDIGGMHSREDLRRGGGG